MKQENEKLIKRFLFGEMAEEERFDLEERFITDANLFEEIKIVEDDLIEKYVRGWMNPAEVSKFEKNFLTTNKRRERVEFSRQLINKLEGQKESVAVSVKKNENNSEDISIWEKLAGLFSTPKIAMAGALALIIGILGSWFLYQNFNTTNKNIVKNENSENIENPIEAASARPIDSPVEIPKTNQNNSVNIEDNSQINANKSNENANKTPQKTPTPNKTTEKPKQTPIPQKTPPISKTAPNPILALFGGTVRSEGKNNVLKLPKEAKAATLQLNLESVDYKNYSAQLTDADGNVLFQKENLKAGKSKINFNVPAKNLKRGDYIIKLFGKNESGENESVADFQFRVQQ